MKPQDQTLPAQTDRRRELPLEAQYKSLGNPDVIATLGFRGQQQAGQAPAGERAGQQRT